MIMKLILHKSDTLGALASALCMLHCLATPFLFIAQTCSTTCCEAAPMWWQWIDYFFLIISFFAVHRSTQTTSSKFVKPALWISWLTLFLIVVNEKLQWLPLPNALAFVAAIALVLLHLYSLIYCQCKTDKCCISHE